MVLSEPRMDMLTSRTGLTGVEGGGEGMEVATEEEEEDPLIEEADGSWYSTHIVTSGRTMI